MITIQTQEVCQELIRALPEGMRLSQPGRLLRVELPIPAVSPLDWLSAQSEWTQYYWCSRDDHFEMAGVGEALVSVPEDETSLEAVFASLRQVLPSENPNVRHYGGFRFYGGPVKGSRWKKFKEYRFIVPRIELCRRGADHFLAYTHLLEEEDTLASLEERVTADLATIHMAETEEREPLPHFRDRVDNPDEAGWNSLVERTLAVLESHDLEKIVLARETSFNADAPIDAVTLTRQLKLHQPGTFCFCFRPVMDRAFLGASPERLFRREGRTVESEALAGTRSRAQSPDEDNRLGVELLSNTKELREHGIVVEKILAHIGTLCDSVETEDAPCLMRLANVQHLHTPIHGKLKIAVSDSDLIAALHPTPAVGGAPREQALAWIAENEPFDRGIYAAPVGWVGPDAAEFCVAIRSGLVQNETLTLYNGAGIVSASTPSEEWAEIEAKMSGFLDIMRGDETA